MRISILYILLAVSAFRLFAADVLLQGTVRDATSAQRIEFATVSAQPGGKSVPTDADGRYYLRLVPGTYTITVSYVG
ncbi:MAG: carboxypeptidase-like regulatory domain-containing protein, partial [Muribaculaceae bacterium]|nr:carboxypeptidase-like regulatory domain-containing protein [Muribaculaceae bacterium]